MMDARCETRNNKKEKAKRNKEFPYRKLRVRKEEGRYERINK